MVKKILFIIFNLTLLLLIKPPDAQANNVIFTDDFSQENEDWIIKEGNWFLENESYKTIIPPDITYKSNTTYINNGFNWDNYSIEIQVMSKNGPGQNILFRLDNDFKNYYWIAMRYEGCADCDNIRLAKLENSNYKKLAEIGPTTLGESLKLNTWYSLKININHNNIKLFFENDLVLDFTDVNPIMQGTVGLEAWSGGWDGGIEFLFDNIIVTEVEEEEDNYPVVLIPGFGASWNLSALTTGLAVGPWIKTPFVSVYDNLSSTLVSSGLFESGVSYFEFYYDWRKNLSDLADDLNFYLTENVFSVNPDTKINIVAHSMGGLISRVYGEKYGDEKLNKVVTVGSPHKGVLKTYYAWEAGIVDDEVNLSSLVLQLFLHLQRKKYQTPKQVVQNLVPSIKNMLPTFAYLKDSSGIKPVSSMIEQNNYLTSFSDSPAFLDKLVTISGLEDTEDKDTVEYYLTENRTILDKLLGFWVDGFPVAKEFSLNGDLTVLGKSSNMSEASNRIEVIGNHGQIMENQVGLEAIISELGLNNLTIDSSNVSLEKNPSLLFFLHSPAQIKVITPQGQEMGFSSLNNYTQGIYSPEDKLIFLASVVPGTYQIIVEGTGNGFYDLEIGQFTNQGDYWQNIKSGISSGEIQTFELNFNPTVLETSILENQSVEFNLLLAKKRLEELTNYLNEAILTSSDAKKFRFFNTKVIKVLSLAIKNYQNGNNFLSNKLVFNTITGCFSHRRNLQHYYTNSKLDLENFNYAQKELDEIIEILKISWINIPSQADKHYSQKRIESYKKSLDKYIGRLEIDLNKLNEQDLNIGNIYQSVKQNFDRGSKSLQTSEFKTSYLTFVLSRFYALELKHLL